MADTWRSTVVIDLEEYDKKVVSLVNDKNTYKYMKKDFSLALQLRMSSLLLTLMKKEELSQNVYEDLMV